MRVVEKTQDLFTSSPRQERERGREREAVSWRERGRETEGGETEREREAISWRERGRERESLLRTERFTNGAT